MVWKGPRSPKHTATLAFCDPIFHPLSLLLGRDPCGDRILRSCLQNGPTTTPANYAHSCPKDPPKGPRHTKNSTRSEFTICSEFATCSDSLLKMFGHGPNTVSGSTVSSTDLSNFFGGSLSSRGKLSELLSTSYLCAKANSPSLSQNSRRRTQWALSSETVLSKQYSARSLHVVNHCILSTKTLHT